MSKLLLKAAHIPSFNIYEAQRHHLLDRLEEVSVKPMIEAPGDDPFVLSYRWTYTDLDGWGKVIPDLVLASDLYKPDVFMCWGYALNAQVECAKRYGLNTFLMCIGKVEGYTAKHAFNIFPYGDIHEIKGLLLFEPNDGFKWAGNAFDIGENGYQPQYVLMTSRR